METVDILIIASAVVLIVLLWVIVGARYLSNLKKEAVKGWDALDELLRKRQNLVPNLIETVRIYDPTHEELVEKLIAERMRAAKEYYAGSKKIEYEHDLSAGIKSIIELEKNSKELAADTNFLEIKSEIRVLNENILLETGKYNEGVRKYNKQIKSIFFVLLAIIFRHKILDIFEVEI